MVNPHTCSASAGYDLQDATIVNGAVPCFPWLITRGALLAWCRAPNLQCMCRV